MASAVDRPVLVVVAADVVGEPGAARPDDERVEEIPILQRLRDQS